MSIRQILHILTRRHLFWSSKRLHTSVEHCTLNPSLSSPHIILDISRHLLTPSPAAAAAVHPWFTCPSPVPLLTELFATFTQFIFASLVTFLGLFAWIACILVATASFPSPPNAVTLSDFKPGSSQQVEVIGSILGGQKSIILSKFTHTLFSFLQLTLPC